MEKKNKPGAGRPVKYPWDETEVGGIFTFYEKLQWRRDNLQRSISTSARHYEKKNPGKKFRTYRTMKDGREIIVVERIA